MAYGPAMETNFLAPGIGLLTLSLLTVLLAPESGGLRTHAFVGWFSQGTLLLGVVFVGAHLVQEIVRRR